MAENIKDTKGDCNMNTIDKNIAYFRKKAGFTREELSQKTDVTSQVIFTMRK